MKEHTALVGLLAAAALIGCAPPYAAPTVSGGGTGTEGCFGALIEGGLVAHDGRLDIQSSGDDVLVAIRWPDRYVVRRDAGRLAVFDAGGRALAREGDQIRLGGGESAGAWIVCGSTGIEVLSSR